MRGPVEVVDSTWVGPELPTGRTAITLAAANARLSLASAEVACALVWYWPE